MKVEEQILHIDLSHSLWAAETWVNTHVSLWRWDATQDNLFKVGYSSEYTRVIVLDFV